LLNIPDACNELRNSISAAAVLLEQLPDSDVVQAWDNMKETIRKKACDLYQFHRKRRVRAARIAEMEASNAVYALRYANGATLATLRSEASVKLAAATQAWQELGSKPLQAANILDHSFGDTSSFYFHQLARSPHPPVVIERLLHPGLAPDDAANQPVSLSTKPGVGSALAYATAFYSSDSPIGLFRPRSDVAEDAQSVLLEALPGPLPAYYAALAEGIDGDSRLHAFELQAAIRAARRGAAPGYDGIPYEVYNAFQEELVPILLRVFNAAFGDSNAVAPLAPLLRGVICLVPKPGQPRDQLFFFFFCYREKEPGAKRRELKNWENHTLRPRKRRQRKNQRTKEHRRGKEDKKQRDRKKTEKRNKTPGHKKTRTTKKTTTRKHRERHKDT